MVTSIPWTTRYKGIFSHSIISSSFDYPPVLINWAVPGCPNNLILGLCNMWRYRCHTSIMSARRWRRWSVPVSRNLPGCPGDQFARDNLSIVTIITDPNVLCHLIRLKSIQSPPSGIRRMLCFISFYELSFRACEFINLTMLCAYLHSSPSECVLRVTDVPERRKISLS